MEGEERGRGVTGGEEDAPQLLVDAEQHLELVAVARQPLEPEHGDVVQRLDLEHGPVVIPAKAGKKGRYCCSAAQAVQSSRPQPRVRANSFMYSTSAFTPASGIAL